MGSLSGTRAIVAGVGGRHGIAVAHALFEQGAEVIAVDRGESTLREHAANMRTLRCDMSETAVTELVLMLEGEGRPIDIVVTCPPTIADMTARGVAASREMWALIVEPALAWTTAAARVMAPRRAGAIAHVTGLSGLGAWRSHAGEGPAFAAVHNVVQNFAVELAPAEVRVNALAPGVDAVEARAIAVDLDRTEQQVIARIPLGFTMPEAAFTDALVYLVHPSSTYVSGQVLAVDGGWSTWGRLHAVAS